MTQKMGHYLCTYIRFGIAITAPINIYLDLIYVNVINFEAFMNIMALKIILDILNSEFIFKKDSVFESRRESNFLHLHAQFKTLQ